MARLIGDKMFPDSVQQRRAQLRERLMELREPVRRRRAQSVPGPNVIGSLESRISDLRDRVVTREGLVSRIKARRSSSDSNNNSGSSSSRGSNAEREAQV